MGSVTVCGNAHRSVAPNRATLDLGLTRVAPTATAAIDDIAARSHQLESVLSALGVTPGDWTTQALSLTEEWEWKNDTNTNVGFRATAGITVRLVVFGQLAQLVRAAVDECGAQVRGLTWSVSADHAARLELLVEAAIDARRRAEAYVTALDLQLGAIEQISESPITGADPTAPMPMFRSAKTADSGDAMSVNAGEIELTASVHVRFVAMPRI